MSVSRVIDYTQANTKHKTQTLALLILSPAQQKNNKSSGVHLSICSHIEEEEEDVYIGLYTIDTIKKNIHIYKIYYTAEKMNIYI